MNNPVTIFNKSALFEHISRITGTTLDELFLDTPILESCKGNIYKLGLILFDIHELTEKEVDYSEEDLAQKFKTIQDIVDYFEID